MKVALCQPHNLPRLVELVYGQELVCLAGCRSSSAPSSGCAPGARTLVGAGAGAHPRCGALLLGGAVDVVAGRAGVAGRDARRIRARDQPADPDRLRRPAGQARRQQPAGASLMPSPAATPAPAGEYGTRGAGKRRPAVGERELGEVRMGALLSLKGVGKSYWRGDSEVRVLTTSRWMSGRRIRRRVGNARLGQDDAVEARGPLGERRTAARCASTARPRGLSEAQHARLMLERIGWVRRTGPQERSAHARLRRAAAAGRARSPPGLRARRRGDRAGGVSEHAGQRWGSLCDGERALIGIAHGIARAPRLLLVDDPTANLDVLERERVTELLRSLADEEAIAVLMTVPDMAAAMRAHQIASLGAGPCCAERAGAAAEADRRADDWRSAGQGDPHARQAAVGAADARAARAGQALPGRRRRAGARGRRRVDVGGGGRAGRAVRAERLGQDDAADADRRAAAPRQRHGVRGRTRDLGALRAGGRRVPAARAGVRAPDAQPDPRRQRARQRRAEAAGNRSHARARPTAA